MSFNKYASECLGSFLLTFCVGLVKVNAKTNPELLNFGPIAIGFCLTGLIYLFANISGGHLNPAVTASAFLQKVIDWETATMYLASQCAGGAGAGMLAGMMYGNENTGVELGPTSEGFWLGAPLVEFLFTFMLCFVFLNVACTGEKNNYYGVAIGFVIIAGGYGGGALSGGAFNPAVTLGVTFMGLTWGCLYLPIYIAVQLAGAIFAVGAFHIVRPKTRVTHEDLTEHAKHASTVIDKLMGLFDPEDTTEFLGTMFYALCVSLNLLAGNAGSVFSNTASFMCLYLSLSDISGGVFNPAITIACLGRWAGTGAGFGKDKLTDPSVSAKEGPKYIIAQLAGAVAGAAWVLLIYLFSGDYGAAQIGCVPVVKCTDGVCRKDGCKDGFVSQAFFAELFGTFFLAYVFLGIATTKKKLEEYGAFAIGGVILAGGYAFGPLSGGVLNPAVTVANAAFYEMQLFYTSAPILYFLGQCLGGVLAAGVFKFLTHPQEYDEIMGNKEAPLLG